MKVKRSSRERRESSGKEAKAVVHESVAAELPVSSFFRKLMLSLEIKICWASRAPKKEKRNIYPSDEGEVGRASPSLSWKLAILS